MGSLFIPNFWRKKIDSDQYFSRLIVYIHNNPVHHGFVNKPDEWPHSSWHAYFLDKDTKVKRSEGLKWFGNMENFIAVHQERRSRNLIAFFEE